MFKDILLAIQDLLDNPNPCDAIQPEAAILLVQVRSFSNKYAVWEKVQQVYGIANKINDC